MKAIILAGGKGTRILPYSNILPKPLLPINGVPLISRLIHQLIENGFDDIYICVGYLHSLVETYLGNNEINDVRVTILREEAPLGTAGPLSNLPQFDESEPLLVLNCDLVTDINFFEIIKEHQKSKCKASVVAISKQSKIKYGVIEERNNFLVKLNEKPEVTYLINSGIYVLNYEEVKKFIIPNVYIDMTDLLSEASKFGDEINVIKKNVMWFDVGCKEDFEKASKNLEENDG